MAVSGAKRISVARRRTTLFIGTSATTLQFEDDFDGKLDFVVGETIEYPSNSGPTRRTEITPCHEIVYPHG
jgi:hypothetical protein